MRRPIALRTDFDAASLRRIARESEDADQVRRLLALAVIYDGGSRTQAAEIGGVTLQVVRDWVLRFNAHGPEGLVDRKAPGQPSRLNDEHRAALATMLESGPMPAVHGVVRWRIIDLCQWVWEEYEMCRIVAESLGSELTPTGVARKYAISSGLLYSWRQQVLGGQVSVVTGSAPNFARVELGPALQASDINEPVLPEAPPPSSLLPSPDPSGRPTARPIRSRRRSV